MRFIADFHVHSRYSMATSRESSLHGFHRWAQLKGITLVGTGDFTHPAYFAEIRENLVETEGGLYRLKDDAAEKVSVDVPASCRADVRFMPTVEISSIYKRHGKTRKVHNVILANGISAAGKIRDALDKIGNVNSDGRPILGLDSRDLLELVLDMDEDSYIIPAHVWTPWFSVFGSRSGFDSLEECYGDLTGHIFAVETGLSSDPPMNWRVSALDRCTLVSNSDCHSPSKLGREANIFDCEMSFPGIKSALKTREGFLGTIEFFPEEGKYHLDGHRKCGVRMEPGESKNVDNLCPVCGKPMVLGVSHRVDDLADRLLGERPEGAASFTSLIPLKEVIGEALGRGPNTKGVAKIYDKLLEEVGSELHVLRDAAVDEIEAAGTDRVAEGVRRMRTGEVTMEPGYDGEFGRVRLF